MSDREAVYRAALRRIARPVKLRTSSTGEGEAPTVDTILRELNRRIAIADAMISEPVDTEPTREIEYEYYELVRHTVHKIAPGEFAIANASVGVCSLCGRTITGMGGSLNMICIPCGDLAQRGQLRAVVKWETPDAE